MIHIYNKISIAARATLLTLLLTAGWSCSGHLPDAPDTPVDGDEMVELRFATGERTAGTRAALADGRPVRLFVYQHPKTGAVDILGTPYRTVEGVTDGVDGDLSVVRLIGGDLTDGKLIVSSGRTYDIVVVADGAPGAKPEGIRQPNAGIITGFTNGQDILAARQTVTAVYGAKQIDVTFKSNGADNDGNLPHLGSAVMVEATVTQDLLDQTSGSIEVAVAGMDFRQCLPKNANVLFAHFGSSSAISVQGAGNTTSFSANMVKDTVTVNSPDIKVTSADGYILPYPLSTPGQNHNVINADFRLRVNGGQTVLEANSIQVPEFKPGYRYRFIVEFDYPGTQGVINLYLSIEPWQALTWDSTMGGPEGDNISQPVKVAVGSWSSVRWSNVMGDDDTDERVIVSVAGWRSVTWNNIMGEE